MNLFIVYELDSRPLDLNFDFTLGGCLFGCVKLTKNVDPDKYSYSGFGNGLDTRVYHSLIDGSVGKNVIIFGVDINSSVHISNKGKDILILGKGTTQELSHTLTAETQYWTNFKRQDINFCLGLHCNGSNNFLFVNATKICQFKAKDFEITKRPLCLGNISKDFTTNNMKKIGLNGYVYQFSFDHDITDTSNIIDIYIHILRYLIRTFFQEYIMIVVILILVKNWHNGYYNIT